MAAGGPTTFSISPFSFSLSGARTPAPRYTKVFSFFAVWSPDLGSEIHKGFFLFPFAAPRGGGTYFLFSFLDPPPPSGCGSGSGLLTFVKKQKGKVIITGLLTRLGGGSTSEWLDEPQIELRRERR